MKQQKRSRSISPNPSQQKQRERSRDKLNKVQYYMGPDFHLTKHYYFLTKKQNSIGYPFAVWNFCILFCKTPAKCLIICQSQSQIYQILQFNKLNRKIGILADHDRQIKKLVQTNEIQVLMMTNRKASTLIGLQQAESCFHLIVNVGFSKDIEFYRKIHEFLLKTGGCIVSFVAYKRDIEKIQKDIALSFNQLNGEISIEEVNKQIITNIQFLPPSKPQTISTLKMLHMSSEQISARLFQLLQKQYTNPQKSKHLSIVGYITYQVITEVQFNSYKYIWNFLKDMPEELSQSIRNMLKFKNRKGAVFNIPIHFRYQMDHFIRKLKKNSRQSSHRFQISIVYQMPQLENTQSEQYRQEEQKKNFAMKHKSQLQIFVSGLPFKMNEKQIRQYFLQRNINALTIRIMRDRLGMSKGVCFILCQDEDHVQRCLKLDRTKINERQIRIHMADKRERRE